MGYRCWCANCDFEIEVDDLDSVWDIVDEHEGTDGEGHFVNFEFEG